MAGAAAGRELEDGAARAGDAEVGGREHALEVVGGRRQAVAILGGGHARSHLLEIARAAQVQDDAVERTVAERVGHREVDAERAREGAEGGHHEGIVGQLERLSRLCALRVEEAPRDRTADDAVAIAVAALDREGEEHAPGERRGEPVREAEVRVGLGQHRGQPQGARRGQHRPGDEAAAAEHGVGLAAAQDARAGERRSGIAGERPHELERGLALEAVHLEPVERVAGLRHQAGLDAARGPREADRRAAQHELLCDREGRHHVSRGAAGGDHDRGHRRAD